MLSVGLYRSEYTALAHKGRRSTQPTVKNKAPRVLLL